MFFHYLVTSAILFTIILYSYKRFFEPLFFPETEEQKQSRIEQLKKVKEENKKKSAELEASKELLDEVKNAKKINSQQEKLDDQIEKV